MFKGDQDEYWYEKYFLDILPKDLNDEVRQSAFQNSSSLQLCLCALEKRIETMKHTRSTFMSR